MDKLTAQQENFTQLLAAGKTQVDAYHEAYPVSQAWKIDGVYVEASKLASNPKVIRRLAALRERIDFAIEQRAVVDRNWVLQQLVENVNMAKQAVPVLDREGNAYAAKVELSAANRALELLGKELGMFVDRQESGKPGEFANENPDEIRKRIAQRQARLSVVTPIKAA